MVTVTRSTSSSKPALPEKLVPVRFPSGITTVALSMSMVLVNWLPFVWAGVVSSHVSASRTAASASTRP